MSTALFASVVLAGWVVLNMYGEWYWRRARKLLKKGLKKPRW